MSDTNEWREFPFEEMYNMDVHYQSCSVFKAETCDCGVHTFDFRDALLSWQKSSLEQRIDDIEKLKAIIKSSLHREMVSELTQAAFVSELGSNQKWTRGAVKHLTLDTAIQIANKVLGGGHE